MTASKFVRATLLRSFPGTPGMWLGAVLTITGACLAPTPSTAQDVAPTWRLAPTPDFSISEVPSVPIHRATYISMPEGGLIVVANTGTGNLIYLDSSGGVRRVVGRPGQGPGEFGRISGLFPAEGRVLVWDGQLRRVSYFSLEGDYQGSFSLGADPALPEGAFANGSVVTLPFVRPTPVGEPRRYPVRDAQGQTVAELSGPLEPHPLYVGYTATSPAGLPLQVNRYLDPGCVASIQEAVVGSEIFTVETSTGVVRAVSAAGSAREVYRGTGVRSPVTAAMQEELRRDSLGVEYVELYRIVPS